MYDLEYLFPIHLREGLKGLSFQEDLEEIRIRIGQPMEFIYAAGSAHLFYQSGNVVLRQDMPGLDWQKEAYRSTAKDIAEMLGYISSYSLYAYQEELCQGYITVQGGHRIGVAGQAAMEEGRIAGMHHISFLNIRIAHEKRGCATALFPYIKKEDDICNTLIFSKPGAGKTTCLRDCIRLISQGTAEMAGKRVCVVDERSEIAACHLGVPQNDLGPRTDVLDGCPKALGMRMLIRSMSPQVLAVDELGGMEDCRMVEEAVYAGSRVLGTVHAGNILELKEKPYFNHWLEKKLFTRYIFIDRGTDGGRKFTVYDEGLERVC